jgi:putative methyltransferase (TIGR04325 family)
MMRRHYCTYFDKNYVPRGLVLLDSMDRHCGDFRLHMLCLDEITFDVLSRLAHPRVQLTRLVDLEAQDPELAAAKPTRSTVEYYFTLTAAWPRYLLQRFAEIDFLAYVDADMCFYSDPEPVYAMLGNASVAITPHRFSEDCLELERYGKYNVGFLGFRRDAAGLACLDWYRDRCIEWCYDRLEGERFGDQKYLEQFPRRFANVAEVGHKGVNVASYNVNGFRIWEDGDRVMIDELPLVLYHFHGVKEKSPGVFSYSLVSDAAAPEGVLRRVLYAGYIERLLRKVEEVRPHFPEVQLGRTERETRSRQMWEYRPQGWVEQDPALTGWDVESVAAYRRDNWPAVMAPLVSTEPFGEGHDHNNAMSFAYVVALAARGRDKLSVLDWGGALAGHYMSACALYPDLAIEYTCREVPSIAAAGRELNPEVRFVTEDREALGRKYDLVLASSVIQYERDWPGLLARLAEACEGYLFVTRTPIVHAAPSFVVVQRVPQFGAAYQGWFINRDELLQALESAGLELVREFAVLETFNVPDAPEPGLGRGFLLRQSQA